jgi:hypothetical protein
MPTAKRALQLNKAYKVIVDEQSFSLGREAHVKPIINVHKQVSDGQETKLQKVLNE